MSENEWEMESSTDDELERPSKTMEFACETNHIQVLASSLTDLGEIACCNTEEIVAESDTAVQTRDYGKQKDERLEANGKSVFSALIKAAQDTILRMLTSIAINSLIALNTTTTAIMHVFKTKINRYV